MAGAALAVLLIGLVNLMHFSQGWVQFGYRFSNDFAPFAMILVTLGIARAAPSGRGVSVAVLLALARSPSTRGASGGACRLGW